MQGDRPGGPARVHVGGGGVGKCRTHDVTIRTQWQAHPATCQVAIRVAVHLRAKASKTDPSAQPVQLEPIWTATPRAANAVGLTALGEASPKPHGRRSDEDGRAISGPLTPVTRGLSRSLADTPNRRSGHVEAETAQIPKLIARPSSPARYGPAAMPLRACSMVTPNCRVPILAVSSQPPFPAADVKIARRCPLARASFPGALVCNCQAAEPGYPSGGHGRMQPSRPRVRRGTFV